MLPTLWSWIKANPKKFAAIVLADIAILAFVFALGRYTTSPKVVEITKTVEVEKVVERIVVQEIEKKVYVRGEDRDVVREIVVVKRPDGTEETRTTETDRTRIVEASTQESVVDIVSEKKSTSESQIDTLKITDNTKQWHASVGIGGGARFVGPVVPQLAFSLQVERRLFGPLFMGANVTTMAGIAPTTSVPLVPPVTITGSLVFGLEL